MEQEQKPFEIRKVFDDDDDVVNYVFAANNEIRRLQAINANHTFANKVLAKCYDDFQNKIKELQQKLADAPSWGEWVDATEENLEAAPLGVYELQMFQRETAIRMKCNFRDGMPWKGIGTESANDVIADENTQFRRLNYEPKAAREVEPPEKTYDYGGKKFTASDMANRSRADALIAVLEKEQS